MNSTIYKFLFLNSLGFLFSLYFFVLVRFANEKRDLNIREKFIRKINELLIALDFSLKVKADTEISSRDIPEYKFYTVIILNLLEWNQQYGLDPKYTLKTIKRGLIREGEIDRKVVKEIKAAIAHFLVITLITWGMIICSQNIIAGMNAGMNSGIKWHMYILLLALHGGGLIIFISLFLKLKELKLKPYQAYFELLYKNLACADSKLTFSSTNYSYPSMVALQHIDERLKMLMQYQQEVGVSIVDDLRELIDELWFVYHDALESLARVLTIIKFSIIIVFYLLPYFIYLFVFFLANMKLE
ncbi:MAG: hypothetical protein HQK49_03220 [Oligoflexia bacterium]|nr:hypothetical protein [Oligoflexia bacterium]